MPTIRNPKSIQSKSRGHRVTHLGGDHYSVESGHSGNEYRVHITQSGGSCSCTWAAYRPKNDNRSGCSHCVAVFNFIESERGRKVSAWGSREDAQRQHRPALAIGDNVILTTRAI